jgi:hypothetical protein
MENEKKDVMSEMLSAMEGQDVGGEMVSGDDGQEEISGGSDETVKYDEKRGFDLDDDSDLFRASEKSGGLTDDDLSDKAILSMIESGTYDDDSDGGDQAADEPGKKKSYMDAIAEADESDGEADFEDYDDGSIDDKPKSYLDAVASTLEEDGSDVDETLGGEGLVKPDDGTDQFMVDDADDFAARDASRLFSDLYRDKLTTPEVFQELENASFDMISHLKHECEESGYPKKMNFITLNYALQAAARREGSK